MSGLSLLLFITTLLLMPTLTSGLASSSPSLNRRDVLQKGASVATTTLFINNPLPSSANASGSALPILVLGASGKTGRECINYLLETGRSPCIATTRTGTLDDYEAPPGANRNLLTIAAADVTNPASLQTVIGQQKLAGVIYSASASKKGGAAAAVDCDGVIAATQACIAAQVPRFVLVSSGAVTQPDSVIYKILNSFGRIMEAKIAGENEVRRLYANPTVLQKNLGYTIVRPGGLSMEPAVGAANLELNQGDSISGRLPRADVAALCVESCFATNAFDTTFECYEALSAKPIGVVGFSNLGEHFDHVNSYAYITCLLSLKPCSSSLYPLYVRNSSVRSKDPTFVKSGRERRGATYADLFEGLKQDPGHVQV